MVVVRDHVADTNQALSITLFVGKVCLTLIFLMILPYARLSPEWFQA